MGITQKSQENTKTNRKMNRMLRQRLRERWHKLYKKTVIRKLDRGGQEDAAEDNDNGTREKGKLIAKDRKEK